MTDKDNSTPDNPGEIESIDESQETEVLAEDNPDTSDASEGSPDEVSEHEELSLMLEDARAKADEHWNQLLRANAELENARKRARLDVENAHKFALEKFVLELLPVKDSLEMGLAAASSGADESGGNEAAAQLVEGTELTLKMLTNAMEKFGIVEINPVGEPFNPDIHQAMSMQESEEHAPNTVMMVMQKGYQLNERLIRPAMVVVSKAVAKEKEGE
jgi:molecular chaperone GrpE